MSFKKNKYSVLKKAISKELANFVIVILRIKEMLQEFYLIQNMYHPLQNIGVCGMTTKCQTPIHIMQI